MHFTIDPLNENGWEKYWIRLFGCWHFWYVSCSTFSLIVSNFSLSENLNFCWSMGSQLNLTKLCFWGFSSKVVFFLRGRVDSPTLNRFWIQCRSSGLKEPYLRLKCQADQKRRIPTLSRGHLSERERVCLGSSITISLPITANLQEAIYYLF